MTRFAIFPFQPASLSSTFFFVFLFNIHGCNPHNVKSFSADVNKCNHKFVVPKPQEHMNKPTERKEGEKWSRRSGTKVLLYPSGLLVPRKCNRLNPWCCCGLSSICQTVPNQYYQDHREAKINATHPLTNEISSVVLCLCACLVHV